MPKRKIKKSYRQVTGVMSSQKNKRMIASESTLERDLYLLLDFDPMVESFEEQPVTIPYPMQSGKKSRYTPDCLIVFTPNPNFIWKYSLFRLFSPNFIEKEEDKIISTAKEGSERPPKLIPKTKRFLPKGILAEVKYREDLIENWSELKPKFKTARKFAGQRNWEFKILTEKEIRTPLLDNIKFMRPYKRYKFPSEEMMKILNRLAALNECNVNELLNSLSDNRMERGRLLPVIWNLVARHEINVNWFNPITMNSILYPSF